MTTPSSNIEFAPGASLDALRERAQLLARLRAFFNERGFLEVETPLLAPEIIPELHIEPVAGDCPLFSPHNVRVPPDPNREKGTVPFDRATWFLQASPELHMKRLLASGATAIYQVTRSFRSSERGRLHNPEFTIVEWYRTGDDLDAGMKLLDELAQSLLRTAPALRTTYSASFEQHLGLNPHTATIDQLAAAADASQIDVPANMDRADRDEWLNLLLALRIEPQLGRNRPEILYHYPVTQSALAKTVKSDDDVEVAERFELYYRGIELANGFHELTDAAEQRRRFEAVNAARTAAGRPALPVPERLLAAMQHGLPPCTGCALGFDRLAMLAIDAASIDDVIAFTQENP